ncbi:MAG: BlaI/MecI/CopY family transcriptional regulator [Bacteroidota bacterium]
MNELTKAEERVMIILWQLKKGVVHDILERLPDPKPSYNTVSTIIRVLEKKGVVGHKAYGKTHEYFPLISEEEYKGFALKKVMNNYFDGSLKRLVSFFTKKQDIDLAELDEIVKLIEENKKQEE